MGRKIRRASLQVQKKNDHNLEDRISLLPDEILILIVSLLSIKEAAITSVLSRRWRYVWAFTTRLHFDASKTFFSAKLIQRERRKYVNWVNHIVELHKSPTIEEFRVGFDLERNFKSDIDKWLKFALARRVNRLVLDFSLDPHSTGNCRLSYTFPGEMFGETKGISLEKLSSKVSIMHRCSFVGLQFLKALCLKNVNVSGDVLGCLLCACHVLEQLCVHGSNDLVHCKVAGPSLVLKYLEIGYCFNIKSMVISNVNLVALKYLGREIRLILENVPLLVELSFGGLVSCYWEDFFPQLSCCLSQLQTLTLNDSMFEEFSGLQVSPELISLKKFVLNSVADCDDYCLLGYTSFIKASPILTKFVLQVEWTSNCSIDKRKVRTAERCPHQHLEEVELAGYYGRITDLELVMYFLENAVALKKIIIDPRDPYSLGLPKKIKEIKKENAARVRAKQQLKGRVPEGIELVIL